MLPTAYLTQPEGPTPTLDELKQVWNLLREYERSPNYNSDCLPKVLCKVRGMGEAV